MSGSERAGRVRSYVRRGGRITTAQRRALRELWPRHGLEGEGPFDLDAVFGRAAPRVLEIGFGMGDALLELAVRHPERDFLGIDVHEPGIGRVLARIEALGLGNVRLMRGDAAVLVRRALPAASLRSVLVFFPDPWPKKRHHKRRLIQPGFVADLVRVLEPGGRLHLATDWPPYAEHMLAVLEAEPALANLAGPGRFAARPPERPLTRFERRGRGLGHEVRDLVFERRAGAGCRASAGEHPGAA